MYLKSVLQMGSLVLHFRNGPALVQRMRDAARALIEERYSPRPVVDKMIAVYHEVINFPAPSRDSLCT